jgi:tyrosine-protein kinase Etk/Wzc
MSFLTLLNSAAAKAEDVEAAHAQPFVSSRNEPPVSFRAHPLHPLVVDPALPGATEHFGVLRTRLLSAHNRTGLASVIVTSPQKEEGKSLICINLGITLGQLGKPRVLLVDGDLRVRGLSELLGLKSDLGVGDYLEERVEFEACIRATEFPSLSIAPAGNLSEESLLILLEGTRWPAFMQQAKEQFDLIIVDSVPVNAPIADFELLSVPCDAVLLGVQLRKTTRAALDKAIQRLGKKLLGVIINNADHETDSKYYSYYNGKKKSA